VCCLVLHAFAPATIHTIYCRIQLPQQCVHPYLDRHRRRRTRAPLRIVDSLVLVCSFVLNYQNRILYITHYIIQLNR
jgi:hypothetical protein